MERLDLGPARLVQARDVVLDHAGDLNTSSLPRLAPLRSPGANGARTLQATADAPAAPRDRASRPDRRRVPGRRAVDRLRRRQTLRVKLTSSTMVRMSTVASTSCPVRP